jgi:hypothetical protein
MITKRLVLWAASQNGSALKIKGNNEYETNLLSLFSLNAFILASHIDSSNRG